MFRISSNGIITITRGDYFEIPLFLNAGDKLNPVPYHLKNDDVVCVYVCEPQQPVEHALIKKTYTIADFESGSDELNLIFESKDTFYVVPGTYYYEIKIVNTAEAKIQTVRSRTQFIILE